MKIGIMSMQRIINYGSWLQAYALKSVLETMGNSVEFVDYLMEPSLIPERPEKSQNMILKKACNICKMLSPTYRDYRNRQIRMNQSFSQFCNRFCKEFLPDLGVTQEYNLCPELDALIVGSDEVFNCTQPGNAVGYSLQLFGKNHRAKKLISYAASFGSTTIDKLKQYGVAMEVGSYLNGFDVLSVRDDNSADIIEELCNRRPEQHIDPVLLYDFPEVNRIDITMRDYIVVYAYAGRIREEEEKAICAFARKNGKKILCLGFYQPFCDEYVLATPLEVLAYVKNADYVITDTFHGTVFSIKYQIPFITLIRDSNRQKLGDLLCKFDLESRCIEQLQNVEDILCRPITAGEVQKKLDAYRYRAYGYLCHALNMN